MRVEGKYISMPFSGITTFLKAPLVDEPSTLPRNSIGVLGIPFDEATTNRPGSRFGPRAIREASMLYTYWEGGRALDRGHGLKGFFDVESGETFLTDVSIADLGDVPVAPTSINKTHTRITDSVSSMSASGIFPFILGGDHSITYPVVKGLGETAGDFWILQIDSHIDYLGELDGSAFTHASPMKLCRELDFVRGVVNAGARGILGDEDVLQKARAEGCAVETSEQILKHGIEHLLSYMAGQKRCYVTLDIDVFDPSIAPGTGVPEPGGLGFREVRAMLREVGHRCEVVGFDVVEVNPLYDPSGITAQLAARTAIDFLGAIYKGKRT